MSGSHQIAFPQHNLRLVEVADADKARKAAPFTREGRHGGGNIRREIAAFTRLEEHRQSRNKSCFAHAQTDLVGLKHNRGDFRTRSDGEDAAATRTHRVRVGLP